MFILLLPKTIVGTLESQSTKVLTKFKDGYWSISVRGLGQRVGVGGTLSKEREVVLSREVWVERPRRGLDLGSWDGPDEENDTSLGSDPGS